MKKKTRAIYLLAILVVLVASLPILWFGLKAHLQQRATEGYLAMVKANGDLSRHRPPEGFVPDKETAIAIAVAVWKPIYGRELIEQQAPYQAGLVDGIWVVEGSMRELTPGGTAKALIRQDTGEILQITHEF